jgi:hypothetical protein
MLRAIEDRGEEGLFVHIFKQSIPVKSLVGKELTRDEVDYLNSIYPNVLPIDYEARIANENQSIPQDIEREELP